MDSVQVVPPIVHYLWSGRNRLFTFQHYLGVLSALRITKPLKVVFHYTDNLPVIDRSRYNSWFSVSAARVNAKATAKQAQDLMESKSILCSLVCTVN